MVDKIEYMCGIGIDSNTNIYVDIDDLKIHYLNIIDLG